MMPRRPVLRPKQFVGVLLKDWPRYREALNDRGSMYLTLCNRNETLEADADKRGYRCLWRWTSDLHAPKFIGSLGTRLLRRALADHPINLAAAPAQISARPDVSFVIGHRGADRLPHLLRTLESIAGQSGASCECVVVEQDLQSRIAAVLPPWVRYVHTPPPAANMPYCRSWAFNVAVRHTRGRVLVLHDNDMLVPADYAARVLEHIVAGYEVANLKRFIFYLTERHTQSVLSRAGDLANEAPLAIVQNLEGGGSVAITREGYERIGGFDESFIGWGGEDNEFWERAQTLRVWPYGYLPIVHLWHAAQPEKHIVNNPAVARYEYIRRVPAVLRIETLRRQRPGDTGSPAGWTGPSSPAGREMSSSCAE